MQIKGVELVVELLPVAQYMPWWGVKCVLQLLYYAFTTFVFTSMYVGHDGRKVTYRVRDALTRLENLAAICLEILAWQKTVKFRAASTKRNGSARCSWTSEILNFRSLRLNVGPGLHLG